MIGVYSILLGAVIVASALILLKREFNNAYFIGRKKPNNSTPILGEMTSIRIDEAINEVESVVTGMSEAFYDIAGDLEGKYSIHEKEISLINDKITMLENLLNKQQQLIVDYNRQLKKIEKATLKKENALVEDTFDLETRIEMRGAGEVLKESAPASDFIESNEVIPVTPVILYEKEDNGVKGRIIALRSEGYSLKQIAKELNIGIGEIQLILNMKRS